MGFFVCVMMRKMGYVDYTGKVVADFKFDLCNTSVKDMSPIPLTEMGCSGYYR